MATQQSTRRKKAPKQEEPPPDPVWTYRGYKLGTSEFVTAMVHFFRAEVQRANVWRQQGNLRAGPRASETRTILHTDNRSLGVGGSHEKIGQPDVQRRGDLSQGRDGR